MPSNSTLQPTPTRATRVVVCYSSACGLARLSVGPLGGEGMGRTDLATKFETAFRLLLAGEEVDLYAAGMSIAWEGIAGSLLGALPSRAGCFFDGVVNLAARLRKQRQIEFTGNMWIGDGQRQWTEPFIARVTDKTITSQGIWVAISVGTDRAEAELWSALGMTRA